MLKMWLVIVLLVVVSVSGRFLHFDSDQTVILIRHAEKLDSGPDLSPAGYERAQCIASFFAQPSFGIQALYAEKPSETSSKRAYETLQPLSEAIGIQINTDFERDQSQEVADAIQSSGERVVLVAWEHKVLTDIIIALGVPDSEAPSYPKDSYDIIWTVVNGSYTETTQPASCTYSQKKHTQ